MARQIYRLLALDIDGTLTADGKTVEPKLARAVLRARSRGIAITLATGRPYPACIEFIKDLEIDNPVVVHNGAVIIDPRTGKILSLNPIPTQKAIRVIRLLHGARVHAFVREIGANGENVLTEAFSKPANTAEREYLKHNATPIRWTQSLEQGISGRVLKILVMDDPDVVAHLARLLEAELGDKIKVYLYTHSSREIAGLEVFASGVSKGAGVRRVARGLGVPLTDVVALGDDVNDMEMLADVGLGVAMGSAPPEVRGAAAFVTGTASQAGAAGVVVHFMLRPGGVFDNR